MEFQCCQCLTEFNQTDHSPLVLPSCGHSICQLCVTKYINNGQTIVCTEDGIECNVQRDNKSFPHNQSIIALLKKRRSSGRCITTIQTPDDQNNRNSTKEVSEFSSEKTISQSQSQENLPKSNICQLHQKELELVCQEDGQYICVNCALFGQHKFHNYLPIEQYCKQIEQAVNEISIVYKQIQTERNNQDQIKQQLINGLNQIQIVQKVQIEQQFNELYRQIDEIKIQVINNIEQNFLNSQEIQSKKFDKDIQILSIESDKWLNMAEQQLSFLVDGGQQSKFKKLDLLIIDNGQQLLKKYIHQKEIINQLIEQSNQANEIQVPIQIIINYITKMMGLNKQKSDLMKQEFTQPLESILEERDNQKKMDQSDFLLDDRQIQEESLYQIESSKPLQIEITKGKRYSGIFSQSQQPTQPTSPSQDMTKSVNFQSTQPKVKERSMTLANHDLLEVSQILVQKQSKFSISHQNSNSKQQKKFTNNPKMNDKLSNSFSLIHQDKTELIDLSQIDFNDQIIQLLGEYLKGKQAVKVLKLSKCKLTDDQLMKLVSNIHDTNINILHLQQNSLTDKCLDQIITHLRQNGQTQLKVLYLNQNSLSAAKSKKKIDELKKQGIQVSL